MRSTDTPAWSRSVVTSEQSCWILVPAPNLRNYWCGQFTRCRNVGLNGFTYPQRPNCLLPSPGAKMLPPIRVVPCTGIEPVIPPWKGGVLTPWPTRHLVSAHVGTRTQTIFGFGDRRSTNWTTHAVLLACLSPSVWSQQNCYGPPSLFMFSDHPTSPG